MLWNNRERVEKCAGIRQNNLVHQVKVILNGLLFHLFLISQPLIFCSADIFAYSTIALCSWTRLVVFFNMCRQGVIN
jgi:hypothetical protein